MKAIRVIGAIAIAVLVLAGCSLFEQSATLVVRNMSATFAIFFLYVSPSSSGSWGSDQLGSAWIDPSETFTLSHIPPGLYDLKAETSTHAIMEQALNVEFESGMSYQWDVFY